ncbi:hypothetical protein [Roseospira visakhapatnamensis]|uniref:Uncharacterized protein n=1 Tax=Roseospira visakhapatnamensis TaxID=390880 RepID=A0A7W6RBJ8_9PROT|nr:hypothetical protein [Roseospira visakhapatnamensis]MBB4264929.1 hypothetical protein [Roseospira visakhapatnamensis]
MRHLRIGAAVAALGLLTAPTGAVAADITFAAVGGPPSIAKASAFVGILDSLTDQHTASMVVVAPQDLRDALVSGRAQVTFDVDPTSEDVSTFEDAGLVDLGPNQMGGLPERHTVVARSLVETAPEVVEFLNLFFVSGSRLDEMASLVEDDTIPEGTLAVWLQSNEPWIRNMLALCPEFSSGSCEKGDGGRPFKAKDWYGTPEADR